ncbi:MAG: xylulokinase [Clostridiales bacterium]|nr:xylulokinase [Clostridiales bacterium]
MACIAGVDLGTSSLKVIVMDEGGTVLAEASAQYDYDSPVNGYGEQNVDVWWQACVTCFQSVVRQVDASTIAGIGFSGQMHGAVFLDEHCRQVRPAILHLDARSGAQLQEMSTRLAPETILSVLMNPPYSGFLVPSLLWVKENEPEQYRRIRHVMMPKDYLRYRLSGELYSDYSDASATLAFDIRRMVWADDVLAALEIPRVFFPDCLATDAIAGRVTEQAARETGLLEGTPMVAGGGDQVMQSIGNGVILPGQATVNIGTSAQVSFQSSRAIENPALNTNTFCGYGRGRWYTMGATMSAGLSMSWLGKVLGMSFPQMEAQACTVPPGAGGLLYMPYLSGERTPHLNPDISGMFWGLSVNTDRSRLARAVMEGVAYSLRECMELCRSLGCDTDVYVASGGGAQSSLWLQIQADVYGVPLMVANIRQHAGVGAAIAAGSGIGLYRDIAEGCRRVVRYQDQRYLPNEENHALYERYYRLYRRAYQDGRQVLEELTALGRSRDTTKHSRG